GLDEAGVVDVDRALGIGALPEDADHVIFRRHVPKPRASYEGRPILTFRFRCEGLPTGETGVERVPPSDGALAALPAQVRDLVPAPRGQVHDTAVHVLAIATEAVHVVDVTLDRPLAGRLFLQWF